MHEIKMKNYRQGQNEKYKVNTSEKWKPRENNRKIHRHCSMGGKCNMRERVRKTNWERNKDNSYGRKTKEMSTHWRKTKFKEETRKNLSKLKNYIVKIEMTSCTLGK